MALLERQSQIDRLHGFLADAARGRGRVAALIGEAGVGKTTLAQAFAESVGDGARRAWGTCEDLSIPDPLGPLHDLARAVHWDLADALGRHSYRLPLFSEALGVLDAPDLPSLLVIEDLHWADDATLDFVRFLGRRIRGTRILLLVTARNDQTDGRRQVRRALADVPADDVERLDVPLLSEAAVGRLARDAGRNGGAVYRATAGNAFFVTELLRAGSDEEAPQSVRDAVLARVDRLSPGGRGVMDAVSIFPRRAEAALVAALCGPDVATHAEECVERGLLTALGDDYAFRHEIARRAVEMMLPPVRRRDLNTRALAVLRDWPDVPVARLVHHAHEARDAAAVRIFAPAAARQAARIGAHREAAGHYMTALAHANTFLTAERAALYEACAFESHLIGRMDQAIRAQGAALALHRADGDRLREGDGLRWLSRLSYLAGDRAAADAYAEQAVELLSGLPPGPELAMAHSNLCHLAMLANDTRQALALGETAIALAEALDRPDILCHALNNVGTSEQWHDAGRGRQLLDRSLAIALEHDFQEHAARTYTNRGCFEIGELDHAAARQVLDAGIAYCTERDLDTWRDYMAGWRAELLLREGRWDEAAAEALRVVNNENASPLVRCPALLALARLRTRRGDPAAEPLIAELRAFLDRGMELQRFAPYATLLAERAWIGRGDRAEALAALDRAEAMAQAKPMIPDVLAWRRMLGAGGPAPDAAGMPECYRRQFAGDWRRAADAWARVGAPFEEALALLDGDAEARRRGLSILDTLGAAPVAAHARQRLRERGLFEATRGPRASTRANLAGLTRRQMDVLRLVDQGRSNAEIAEALFVSPKTIDHHISAILDKLDARSRGEAAAAARRTGLIAS
jgi:predicted ATPase